MDVNVTPNQSSNSEKAVLATLKIISNKTHVGPVRDRVGKSFRLSAAANKIRINNDLKVSMKSDKDSSTRTTNKTSESLLLSNPGQDASVKGALTAMESWDREFNGPGTPAYVEKANALSRAQSRAYSVLGINPTGGIRPELTEEQRVAYNDMVSPYAFDYYEVRLSYKQPGQKSVRSTTYRFLDRPSLSQIKERLNRRAKAINDSLSIEAEPTN